MSILGYQDLQCPNCDGKAFANTVNLVWKEGMGVSQRPAGFFCLGCQKPVDTENSIRAIKRRHLIEKQKELENAL